MQNISKYVMDRFNSKVAQDYYIKKAKDGLWKPEEILIKKYFRKGKVLDVGCGTGRTTIPLHKMGFDVIGIDIAKNMIKNAKKVNHEIKYEVEDAAKLRYKSNSFDNVLFSNNGWAQTPVKENRTKAIKEINRVLKKNGHYIFSVQSRWLAGFDPALLLSLMKFYILKPFGLQKEFGDLFFKEESGGALKYDKKQYMYLPDHGELRKELEESGFKIELVKMFVLFRGINLFFPVFYVCKKI
jgi:ubiquinone/menaquinone biosynthesis C-methylase UbiE